MIDCWVSGFYTWSDDPIDDGWSIREIIRNGSCHKVTRQHVIKRGNDNLPCDFFVHKTVDGIFFWSKSINFGRFFPFFFLQKGQKCRLGTTAPPLISATTQCLKILEKVSFNIASEASYVYIFTFSLKMPKLVNFGDFFKHDNWDILGDFQTMWWSCERSGNLLEVKAVNFASSQLNSEMAHPWSYVYAQMEQKPNPSCSKWRRQHHLEKVHSSPKVARKLGYLRRQKWGNYISPFTHILPSI